MFYLLKVALSCLCNLPFKCCMPSVHIHSSKYMYYLTKDPNIIQIPPLPQGHIQSRNINSTGWVDFTFCSIALILNIYLIPNAIRFIFRPFLSNEGIFSTDLHNRIMNWKLFGTLSIPVPLMLESLFSFAVSSTNNI